MPTDLSEGGRIKAVVASTRPTMTPPAKAPNTLPKPPSAQRHQHTEHTTDQHHCPNRAPQREQNTQKEKRPPQQTRKDPPPTEKQKEADKRKKKQKEKNNTNRK